MGIESNDDDIIVSYGYVTYDGLSANFWISRNVTGDDKNLKKYPYKTDHPFHPDECL